MSRVALSSKTSIYILCVALLVTLSACAPLAEVRSTKATLKGEHGTVPELQRAEEAIANGQELQHTNPGKAIGCYLRAVELSEHELQKAPNDRLALRDYDFGLSRIFSVIRNAGLEPWTHPMHVPAPDGKEYVITQGGTSNPLWQPQYFDLIPADELDVRGKFVVPHVRRAGVGAALVAVRVPNAPSIRQCFIPPRVYLAVTALAHFREQKCEIEFLNPLATETASISGHTMPAEADLTAPLAVGLAREHPEKFGAPAMLSPETFAAKTELMQIQPYDPNKIPVLLIHGLQSTPASWARMVNAFWADPVIRTHYQVWVFGYPSGYPIPYSALLLRRQLDTLAKSYPKHARMVLVGHSMGGILSRLMVSDSEGERVWRYFFSASPAQTRLSPASKALLEEALIFTPRRDVGRVVFISTPHRGSMIAQGPIGRLTSSLIHKPTGFVQLSREILATSVVQQEDPAVMKLNRLPNSIDTLSPNDPFVRVMNTLPIERGVPYHSIIGDRGRGDTPKSSDGVVPYWSSHVAGAASEKIVPSGHGANQNAEAIAEVIAILKQHLRSGPSAEKKFASVVTLPEHRRRHSSADAALATRLGDVPNK